MPLTTTAEIVRSATADRVGVPAFNVITLEHAEAIVAGAEEARAPVVLQVSENAVRYHGGRLEPITAACRALAAAAAVPVSLHLDHVEDEALCRASARTGYSSVMVDASRLDYDRNVAVTAAAARWAHEHDMWVEAELGEVGGKDGAHAPGARTDPGEAAAFVRATQVDALAVAVGSAHAMRTRTAELDHDLIARLAAAVDVPLVLHGSSGVPPAALRRAVTGGMVKINVGTALNLACTGAVRAHLDAHPHEVDPRKYLAPGRDAMTAAVAELVGAISAEQAPSEPSPTRA
jgi:fructose-bisphosphate aldolase class II